MTASALGIEQAFAANKDSTGFILLIDAESGRVISRFGKNQCIKQMSNEITTALRD